MADLLKINISKHFQYSLKQLPYKNMTWVDLYCWHYAYSWS